MEKSFFKQPQISVVLIVLLGLHNYCFAQSGQIDTTFGNNGFIKTALDTFVDKGNAIAIQTDGKILLSGTSFTSYTTSVFVLLRYDTDGLLDSSFGSNGSIKTVIENRSMANALAIQNDGKIIVGGESKWHINLARYQSNGSLDTSFGNGGVLITDVPGYYKEKCKSIALQSDGKIIVGGFAKHNSSDQPHFLLVRYNSNGSLDSTFGINGFAIGDIGNGHDTQLESSGKILISGIRGQHFAATRFNSNGILDTSFGINGLVETTIGSNSKSQAMALQNDGKIILAGYSIDSNIMFTMARYRSNGNLDTNFGAGGKVITPLGNSSRVNTLTVQTNGKIILAGDASNNTNTFNFALARYHTDGKLDNSFGINGKVITPMANSQSFGKSIRIDNDGKIILGGYANNGSNSKIVAVRYINITNIGVPENLEKSSPIKIYPHPFSNSTTVDFGTQLSNAELKVFNALGQLVVNIKHISGKEMSLNRNHLPAGNYTVQLIENKKNSTLIKLVIIDE